MANAKRCDRCGSYYDSYNYENSAEKINGIMLINIDSNNRYFSHEPYDDLCPICSHELMKWFKKEKDIW